MNKLKLNKKQRIELLGIFFGITFITFFVSLIIVIAITYLMVKIGVFQISKNELPKVWHLMIFIALLSVVINIIFIIVSGKIWLEPVKRLISGMKRFASGDYSARMEIGKPFGNVSVIRAVSESFNTMAEELQNTELLRSDFINNFSHEFKTPIVSIAGFAKLLKQGNISETEQKEYVCVIEEEALRLSDMATNMLNLTKVENQTILTDISAFNLSEQIRNCILLLEEKWTKKHLDLYIDFNEYMICANKELLKHVWINLIDNAIKFSPEYGTLEIDIKQDIDNIFVSVSNSGECIPLEIQNKIFDKFYQADTSHATPGNGIGLAVVKRVVDLHHGDIIVQSTDCLTTFTVKLPKWI